MASKNPLELLGDEDTEDPSDLAAVAKKYAQPPPQAAMHAPATVREGRSEGRGGEGNSVGCGCGLGRGRHGKLGYYAPVPGQGAPQADTGKGIDIKARASEIIHDAPTGGNWGDLSDIVNPYMDAPYVETEEKKPELMTLEEYQKVLEEKKKSLQVPKTEERKVDTTAFQSMQQLSNKKDNDDICFKQGSDKDKQKEAREKDVTSKKPSEFMKPAEAEEYHSPGGRDRGRSARGYGGGGARLYSGMDSTSSVMVPVVGDTDQFPKLGSK